MFTRNAPIAEILTLTAREESRSLREGVIQEKHQYDEVVITYFITRLRISYKATEPSNALNKVKVRFEREGFGLNVLKQLASIAKKFLLELTYSTKIDPSVFPELNIYDYEEYHESGAVGACPLRVKLISNWIEPDSTVLDVGCGEGINAGEIAKLKKVQVYGIDVSAKAMSKFVSKGFQGEVKDIDNEGLDLKSTYDYILFVEVLEHLKWPHRVLIEACEHARRGVIVTLPNSGYLRWRLQMLRGYCPRQSFTHLHFWSINDFSFFLRALGLQALDFKTDLTGRINFVLRNLFAFQQCWLIAPRSEAKRSIQRLERTL